MNPEQPVTNEEQGPNYAAGLLGTAAGANLISKSTPRLLGRKNVLHGTNKDRVESIKENGLQPSYGGTGASFDFKNDTEIKDSTGRVFVTSARSVALDHANTSGLDIHDVHKMKKNDLRWFVKLNPKAHVQKINMDYEQWKRMEADPHILDEAGNLPLQAAPIGMQLNDPKSPREKKFQMRVKDFASRGTEGIAPSDMLGNGFKNRVQRYKETAQNLPGYIKRNPGRFGGGVAGAAVGGYAIDKGVGELMSGREKEANAFEFGLLKMASDAYPKADEIRAVMKEEGRPIEGSRFANYLEEEAGEGSDTGAFFGGGLGLLAGAGTQKFLNNREVEKARQEAGRADANYVLAKGNTDRSLDGALVGVNTFDDYHNNLKSLEKLELERTVQNKKISQLLAAQKGVALSDVMNPKTEASLFDYAHHNRRAISGGVTGALIGAGTLATMSGNRALRDGAPEAGMEDHEVVKDVSLYGEPIGTIAGGLAGSLIGHKARTSLRNTATGTLIGTALGMGVGRSVGSAVERNYREE